MGCHFVTEAWQANLTERPRCAARKTYCDVGSQRHKIPRVKYGEIIVNKMIKAGFNMDWVSTFEMNDGRTV
jgi:hypothetical protein